MQMRKILALASLLLFEQLPQTAFPQDVQLVWSGAVTAQSAKVKAKLITDSTEARLAVSVQPDLSLPVYSNWDTSITSENNRIVSFEVSGLLPNTQYYYGVEIGGSVDTLSAGRFHTFPEGTASFTFALGSCAQTGSNHAVFQAIESLAVTHPYIRKLQQTEHSR